VEEILHGGPPLAAPPLGDRIAGWYLATKRRWTKKWKGRDPGSPASSRFQRHRYPGLSLADVRARVADLQRALRDESILEVDQLADDVFRIWRRAP
jgi:hypothetical protein